MAGIEHTKAALADVRKTAADLREVAKDGLTAGDLLKVPELVKDGISMFNDAKAAKDAGEISDLDWEEITVLWTDVTAIISDLLKGAA